MPANGKPKEKARALKWVRRGKTAKWAAEKVGVNPATVSRWAQAEPDITLEYPYNAHQNRTDLVDKQSIIDLSAKMFGGKPLFLRREIAEMCECSESYVKIVRRQHRDGLL
jgi:transposase